MKTMMKKAALGVAGTLCGLHAVLSQAANPIAGALGETKPIVDTRLRSEYVDQLAAPALRQANALTLRARLGFETGRAWNTSLLVEGEAVGALNRSQYRQDNAVTLNTNYPVVADPQGLELNRLQLTNISLLDTTIVLGRQRVNIDDQRFIGAVGWRQNEQTLDAFRVTNRHIANLVLDAGYFNRVNRVFGPDSPQGNWKGRNWFANVAYQTKIGKVTGFGVVLDLDPIATVPAALNPLRQSTATYGLRFAGDRVVGPLKVAYVGSYAQQKDAGANPLRYDNHYSLLELYATWKQYTLGVGDEVLSGYLAPGSTTPVGFATPLATLHKFQGWADKFLTTPGNGIVDRYATLTWLNKGVGPFDTVTANLAWHNYAAQRINADYGSELNVLLAVKYHRPVVTLKYARYTAAASTPTTVARDTDKLWCQVEYTY